MSNIYIQEPPTSGKVLLETTVGDIEIELWAKETPKACRNFVQLCMEQYYKNVIFHRIVKDFIVQTGDPTGSGMGGESIYGKPFKDEFHTRLRFNRRGLVAMANAGRDDNASQFFITLGSTPELQNKHTIFGKVAGETIFNVLKLQDALVDKNETPVYPEKILKCEVLMNPFDDIVLRIVPKTEKSEKEKEKKKSKPGVKNFKLLSFGNEAMEDEEETIEVSSKFSGKTKSIHDLLDDPTLSSNIEYGESLEEIKEKNPQIPEEQKSKTESPFKNLSPPAKKSKKNTEEEEEEESSTENLKNSEYHKMKQEFKLKQDTAKLKGPAREEFTMALLAKFRKKITDAKEKKLVTGTSNEANEDEWLAHELHFEDNDPVVAKDANTKTDDWFEIYDPRNSINKKRREASQEVLSSRMKNK